MQAGIDKLADAVGATLGARGEVSPAPLSPPLPLASPLPPPPSPLPSPPPSPSGNRRNEQKPTWSE